jgi:hypothetical protein
MQTQQGWVMKSISFKDKIEKDIVETIQSNEQVHDAINNVVKDKFVEKETFDQRFDRILEEMRSDREDRAKDREEGARKWDESRKQWEENNQKWAESVKNTEETNRKWDESQKHWEESNQKWHENQTKLVANDQKWAESVKQTEETNRKWDESRKQWAENNRKWDESVKDREENAHKWDESTKEWAESRKRWEDNDRKWHENQKAINDLISKMDTKFENLTDSIKSTVGALGARWGIRTEQSFRNALKGILEKNTDFKVLHVVERDESGVVFGRPEQIELDIVVKNGKLLIIEIKSSVGSGDVLLFAKKAEFYQERHSKRATALVMISPMIDDKGFEYIAHYGMIAYSYASEVDPVILD